MVERIETERLILRKAKEKDLDQIWQNVWMDGRLAATMLWAPTLTREDALLRLQRTIAYQSENDSFFVCLKESTEPIGFGGIREVSPGVYEETGICIAKAHQGRGSGTETLCALVDFAFRMKGGNRFEYGCFHDNATSAALCKSCGFVYTHSRKMTRAHDGYEYLCDFYELLN